MVDYEKMWKELKDIVEQNQNIALKRRIEEDFSKSNSIHAYHGAYQAFQSINTSMTRMEESDTFKDDK